MIKGKLSRPVNVIQQTRRQQSFVLIRQFALSKVHVVIGSEVLADVKTIVVSSMTADETRSPPIADSTCDVCASVARFTAAYICSR